MAAQLSQSAVFDAVGFVPHAGQRPILRADNRFKVVAAGRRFGKALALDTVIPTPDGWTTMSELSVGDWVIASSGEPTQVTAVTEVMHDHDCYELTFTGGQTVVADAGHQWNVRTMKGKDLTLTTSEIARTFKHDNERGDRRYKVLNAAPIQLPPQDLLIDPYTLGVWLGDGRTGYSEICVGAADLDIVDRLHGDIRVDDKHVIDKGSYRVTILGFIHALRALGVADSKHVPAQYLRGSVEQRTELLRGLMDTDGTASKNSSAVSFCNMNEGIARAVYELATSLGERAQFSTKRATLNGKDCGTVYVVGWTPCRGLNPFHCRRKAAKVVGARGISVSRTIREVRKVESVPVRCIQTQDSTYLCTRAMIPTHNSEIGGNDLVPLALASKTHASNLIASGKRMEYWVVGPEYSDAEKEFRIFWNALTRLGVPFDKPGSYNNPLMGDLHVSLWGGAFQLHGKSAKHPETLVGEGLHGVILAEAAKLKERVWTKFIRPTLNDFTGFAWMTSTPEGKNWFYEAWQRGQDPKQAAWKSWRRPAWMNPHVYRKGATAEQIAWLRELIEGGWGVTDEDIERCGIDPEVAQLVLDLTETMFNQEIAADFTEYVGRVFKDFDEEVHVTDLSFNPDWATYAAVDYGFTNPNVWLLLQVSPWGTVHVLDEVYERGLSPLDFAREIERRGLNPGGLLAFYPDPASPGDTSVLEAHLRVKGKPHTGGELKHRLDAIRSALKRRPSHLPDSDPNKVPALLFDRKCVNAIKDFNDYRYPERRDEQNRNAPEAPMKKDDHAPEALGRFYAGHFRATKKRRARQTVAQMG